MSACKFENAQTEGIVGCIDMTSNPRRLRRRIRDSKNPLLRRKVVAKAISRDEEKIIQKFRSLSPEKKREAIDYLDLLSSGKKAKDWVEFDEWALNLSKKRGFNRLTEKDVARIVSDYRSNR